MKFVYSYSMSKPFHIVMSKGDTIPCSVQCHDSEDVAVDDAKSRNMKAELMGSEACYSVEPIGNGTRGEKERTGK